MIEHIQNAFTESIQTKIESADTLPETIAKAGDIMVNCLIEGRKILTCGNGFSAGLAQHFVSTLLHSHLRERPSLPAIALTSNSQALTSLATNNQVNELFAKQIRSLGQESDVLLVISGSGSSKSTIKAIEAALSRDMLIVAITGKDGGNVAGLIGPNDIEIRVPSNSDSRIQELHTLVINTLSDYIENSLFGEID
ncbi:SIS domain-containing protein [Pleionea sediminis]|uniref:D-sedoheptulose-7-phosphate isomerase n=1 Tax=Pleionea sediminis TaxID=2569479 RepID=UPI001185E631